MDDKEDREVTLKEIDTYLFRKMTDAVLEYNEFIQKNKNDLSHYTPLELQLKAVIKWEP